MSSISIEILCISGHDDERKRAAILQGMGEAGRQCKFHATPAQKSVFLLLPATLLIVDVLFTF